MAVVGRGFFVFSVVWFTLRSLSLSVFVVHYVAVVRVFFCTSFRFRQSFIRTNCCNLFIFAFSKLSHTHIHKCRDMECGKSTCALNPICSKMEFVQMKREITSENEIKKNAIAWPDKMQADFFILVAAIFDFCRYVTSKSCVLMYLCCGRRTCY